MCKYNYNILKFFVKIYLQIIIIRALKFDCYLLNIFLLKFSFKNKSL